MAPRSNPKARRGPELWIPKKSSNSTDDSQKVDDSIPAISLSRSRNKFPPGPDLAASVTKEFFDLPPEKSLPNRRSVSAADVALAQSPPSEDGCNVHDAPSSVPEGNVGAEATTPISTPVVATGQDAPEDYVDRWRRKFPNVPNSWGDRQSAEGARPAAKPATKYDAMWNDEDTLHNRGDMYSPSPSSLHRRSRRHRRHSSGDSDESPWRRRRSHRSKRRRSRRSPSFSTSGSSSGRDRKRKSSSRHYSDHNYRGHGYGHSDSETGSFYEEDIHPKRRSSEHMPHAGFDVPSRGTRGVELKVPLTNSSLNFHKRDEGVSERGGSSAGGGSCTVTPFLLKKESEARKDKRDRQKAREDTASRRVDAGKKKFFIHVNEEGRPYGYGVGTWHEMVGKLVRGLDPSFIDIRHQPFHLMDTLISRLNEDFDYQYHVNPTWLRGRIGSALSSYRHELIKLIEAKCERPSWVSEDIWSRLVTMAGTEKFRAKSEQMKRANSCRKTKGRTGPIGIAGVTERLRVKLGRTPDPDEVQEEVTRDKSGDRRSRTKVQDRECKEADDAAVILSSSPRTSGIREESAPAGREVTDQALSNSTSVFPVRRDMSETDSAENLSTVPDSDDPDVRWALSHPLGKVLLKQMAEVRSLDGCGTVEKKMVLDSLMSQIRNMRSTSNQKLSPDDSSPATASAPSSSSPSPAIDNSDAAELPDEEAVAHCLSLSPTVNKTASEVLKSTRPKNTSTAATRKSERIPKKKNRSKNKCVSSESAAL